MSNPDHTDSTRPTGLKIGDVVTWTHTVSNGNSIRFTTRMAKVIHCGHSQVWVKYRGRKLVMRRSELRRWGEKTQLTEAFETHFVGPAKKEHEPAGEQSQQCEPTTTTNEGRTTG